jgi:hypothetical protein
VGFAEKVRTGIRLAVGQEAGADVSLQLGAVSQEVKVRGDAALVIVTTQDIAGLVGEQQVKDLPLNGRSYDLLVTLNPASSTLPGKRPAALGSRIPLLAITLRFPETARSRICSC